jgi:hypothetical protein
MIVADELVALYQALDIAEAERHQSDPDLSLLSPLQWAEQNATIVLPTEGRMPFAPYPYQRDLLEDRSLRRVVLKARQTGMSNVIAIEALHLAITRPDSTILFVSRNQQAARVLITYAQHTLSGLPPAPAVASLPPASTSTSSRSVPTTG